MLDRVGCHMRLATRGIVVLVFIIPALPICLPHYSPQGEPPLKRRDGSKALRLAFPSSLQIIAASSVETWGLLA